MKKVFLLLSSAFILGKAQAQGAGTLDATFGTNGVATANVSGGINYFTNSFTMGIQSTGKIVVGCTVGDKATIYRFNTDGSLDNTFGGGDGIWQNTSSGLFGSKLNDLKVLSDNSMVICGQINSEELYLETVPADGSGTGAPGGLNMSNIFNGVNPTSAEAKEVLVINGQYFVVGTIYDGAEYSGFYGFGGTWGNLSAGYEKFDASMEGYEAVDFYCAAYDASTSQIVIGGSASYAQTGADWFIGTLYSNGGGIDNEFVTPLAGIYARDAITDLRITSSGTCYFSGVGFLNATTSAALIGRVTYSNVGAVAPDNTFDGNGLAGNSGFLNNFGSRMAIQTDGKLIHACENMYNGQATFSMTRRAGTDGALDASFGTAGEVNTVALAGYTAHNYDVAIQSNGKILLAGFVENTSGDVKIAVARYNASCASALTPIVSNNNNTLSVSSTSGTFAGYQWLLNGSPIAGATNATYTATVNGDYSVDLVDAGGCTVSSSPLNVVISGVETLDNLGVTIFPNPTTDVLNINGAALESVELYALDGRLVLAQQNATTLDMSNLPAGIYTIRIRTAGGTGVTKVVKQ